MNAFGKYIPDKNKTPTGKQKIDPTLFIVSNWDFLCSLTSLPFKVSVNVITGLEADKVTVGDTAAMFILGEGKDAQVCINKTDLDQDCLTFTLDSLNPLGILWAYPAGMIRALLFHHGLLSYSDLLGPVLARRAGYPAKVLQDCILKHVGFPEGSSEFKRRFDSLFIQGAIQRRVELCGDKQDVDWDWVNKMIWAKRDSLDPGLITWK